MKFKKIYKTSFTYVSTAKAKKKIVMNKNCMWKVRDFINSLKEIQGHEYIYRKNKLHSWSNYTILDKLLHLLHL